MKKPSNLPLNSRQLKKWQLALLGLTNPSNQVLDVLFPPGIPYTKLARAVVELSLDGLHRATRSRLIKSGYIVKNKLGYELTKYGKRYSKDLLSWYVDRRPSRWDGKWRMVIFDVPETHRRDREYLRRLLVQYGFKKLQASVWASPYTVPQEFNQRLWDMRIKHHVLYLLVTSIDYDRVLMGRFPDLPKR
jgi:DNA-binding transcriptional regulator PaaX